MSLYSSLCIVYPGSPPKLTAEDLHTFCTQLRAVFPFGAALQRVQVKFGRAIDQDFETTQLMKEVAPGMMQFVEYPWDHEKRDAPWEDLWPSPKRRKQVIYRAEIGFGSLPKEISREFTAISPDERNFIAPDSLSLSIGPFAPETLSKQNDECLGFIHLSLSGNGCFTWQPLEKYWDQIRQTPSLAAIQRACREAFPVTVPKLPVQELQEDLGPLFLNGPDYQEGDWMVTVAETG